MKQISLFLIFFLNALPLFAQYSISGQIYSENNKPIEFATVIVYPSVDSTSIQGVITDKQSGQFKIDNLSADEYYLVIQMLGYEDLEQVLTISTSEDLGKLILKEEAMHLETIEVVAEQSTIESRLGKKVLRIGQDLSTTGSNALEALENIPSISTTQKGKVLIRGNSNIIIYINGKETRRDPANLKYISAEVLEKIEVITNPSAKYDAEGVAGIINLVYKKNKRAQFKLEGILNLTLPLAYSSGFNVSLNKDKFSFFTNIALEQGFYKDFFNTKRNNYNTPLSRYENNLVHEGAEINGNINVGAEMEIDSTASMALEINYDRWDFLNNTEQENLFYYQKNELPESYLFRNEQRELENELWVNYSISKAFNPSNLLTLSLTTGGEDENNYFTNKDNLEVASDSPVQQFLIQSDETEKQRYYQGKLDFETSFFKTGKIEAGLKTDFIQYTILQDIQLRSNDINIPTNDFTMDMQKLGVYILQSHQIKRLEYALGLRLEQFSSEALQVADQNTFTQRYLEFFPSVQLNYWLPDESHTIGFNYTRRINRPSFFNLNPYISYEDPLNLQTGNPSLRPEIANLYEASYHKGTDNFSMDLTAYRRVTNDAIQSIIKEINGEQTIESSINFAKKISQGIEGQFEYRITKSLKTTASFVAGQVAFSDNEQVITFNKRTFWAARLKQQIKLADNWKIEFSESYNSPRFGAQTQSNAVFYMNLHIGKKFNNKRGSISLGLRDIFNTRQDVETLQTENFDVKRTYKWQTRRLTLGLRYYIING